MPDEPSTAKILIVDDEPTNVRLLERLLQATEYRNLESTTDSRRVVELYRAFRPDLILLDLRMPHLDGIAVLEQLKAEIPADEYLPIVVLTADVTLEAKHRALAAGAKEFVTKPLDQLETLLRIGNLLHTRRLYLALEAQKRSLEETVRDRTDRLIQSEKVAAMGSLLAGVAHELNNPLTVILGSAELLIEDDPESVAGRVDSISGAAHRCVRIVRNFLSLVRQRPPERTDVRLHDVVQGAVELLAYELRVDDVEVAIDVQEDLPILSADPHQLHQVLVNLITNAHHAMRCSPHPRRIVFTARHDAPRGLVRLEVTDTGPGIPQALQAKIFEPFFTTKPTGEGTGLGLSLCRGSIEEHGGTIEVDSEPGRGSRFTIELPLLVRSGPAAGAETPAALPPVSLKAKAILVVDDEPDLAAVIAEVLERDGHKVGVATNGAMALEMLANHPYDLLLSDVRMPVLDGEGLYLEVERRFPALRDRIIFLTGDVLGREKQKFFRRIGAPTIVKPCDLAEVRRLVHQVLADRAG